MAEENALPSTQGHFVPVMSEVDPDFGQGGSVES